MGKGRTYELNMAGDIGDNTSEDVHVAVSDYSGSARNSVSDIEVYYIGDEASSARLRASFCELKKTTAKSGNRDIVMSGSSQGENGRDELERLIAGTPSWAEAYVVISWNNRRPIIIDAHKLRGAFADNYETSEGPPFFDARLTNSGNISMRKPELANWHSSASSDEDWRVIAEGVGVPTARMKVIA